MNYEELSKEELIELLKSSVKVKGGRKGEVLNILRENGNGISIKGIGNKLGISDKNVSSLLCYLRTDGFRIFSDDKGRKILIEGDKELVVGSDGKMKVRVKMDMGKVWKGIWCSFNMMV